VCLTTVGSESEAPARNNSFAGISTFNQPSSSRSSAPLGGVVGPANRLAHGDAAGAGGHHVQADSSRYPANGEHRQRRLVHRLPDEFETGELLENFGRDGKVGPTPR